MDRALDQLLQCTMLTSASILKQNLAFEPFGHFKKNLYVGETHFEKAIDLIVFRNDLKVGPLKIAEFLHAAMN